MIRDADPERDAAACAAIYAPYVEAGADLVRGTCRPSAEEMAARIADSRATHPWLVAEDGRRGRRLRLRLPPPRAPRLPLGGGRLRLRGREQPRRRVGRALYEALFERLRGQRFQVACAGITLPNEASVALHERLGFARSASARGSAGSRAPGATSAGGSWSCAPAGHGPPGRAPPARPAAGTRLPLSDAESRDSPPEQQAEVLTEEDVFEALEEVIDPELGPRLRLPRPRLRRRDRERRRLRHLHPDHPGLPDRPPGLRADEGVRRRPPRRHRRPPEDGLRPPLVTGDDDRGRQVRAGLLGRDSGVIGGLYLDRTSSPNHPHASRRTAGCLAAATTTTTLAT